MSYSNYYMEEFQKLVELQFQENDKQLQELRKDNDAIKQQNEALKSENNTLQQNNDVLKLKIGPLESKIEQLANTLCGKLKPPCDMTNFNELQSPKHVSYISFIFNPYFDYIIVLHLFNLNGSCFEDRRSCKCSNRFRCYHSSAR